MNNKNKKWGCDRLPLLLQQFIVCYDIENCVIYEVFDLTAEGIERTPQTQELRRAIAGKLGQAETRFIDKSNKQRAEEIIKNLNDKAGTSFTLGALTHKYLSNFYIYNNKTGEITSKFATTVEEDNAIFGELIEMWEKGADILFTAHNLDYEYSFIRYNTTFLTNLLAKSKKTSIIANGTHDIKSLEFIEGDVKQHKGKTYINNQHKFLIRDSFLMTGKSIRNLGNAYELPKLEYDYEVTRINPYELTEEDYAYNQRDNEIALRAILEIQQQQEMYKDITKLPMSATQHSRNTCRNNPVVNPQKGETTLEQSHIALSSVFNMPSAEMFNKFFNASGGGLIGVNPEETYKWHSGVYSFDIKSAHPSQAFNKRFPKGDEVQKVGAVDYKKVISEIKLKSMLMRKMPKKFYNTFCPNHDYLILCELKGVKEKNINGNIINSLGAGKVMRKCESSVTNRIARNVNGITAYGKVRSSESYTKWFYGIDLMYHLSFYDVEEINIIECFKYPLVNCDEYIVKQFEFYGENKEVYKKFTKVSPKMTYEEIKEVVENSSAEEYTKRALSSDDYTTFLDNELLRIKGIFNGLFGQQYQCPIHNDMSFDVANNYCIIKGDVKDYEQSMKKCSIHYCVGAYIALWSRFELACMIWHVINSGGKIFYFATDSVKCNGVSDDVFDGWCYGHTSTNYERNVWNFGSVDCENKGNPMYFFTPETLKHIDIGRDGKDKDKVHIGYTISGFKAGVYLEDFISKWGSVDYTEDNIKQIQDILADKFKPQYIPAEYTGKLVRDRKFAGITTGLNQVNFGALQPMGYNLGGFNEQCEEYQNVD